MPLCLNPVISPASTAAFECLKGIADFLNFMRRYKPVLFWWLGRGQLCDSGRSFQKNLAEGVVCGEAIKETKIGYLLGREMHADGLPLYQDSEQDCDRSALRPIIDLKIFVRSDTQPGFFSHLAF
jgi:hypothetical protein